MAMCVPCVWLVYGDVCGVYQGWRLFRGKVVVGRGHALVGCCLVWVVVIAAVGACVPLGGKQLYELFM